MIRCSKCTLSEATPAIEFDEEGVCNYCKSHKKIEYQGEDGFKAILDKHRDKNQKYDCIAAVSGGRDSSYILLKLVKDYKMKVLAVNYANPFTDPQAKKNIENATRKLNVDLVTIEPKKDIHRKTYSSNFKTWCKRPHLGVLPLVCIACKLMWYEIIKTAKKHNVHLIVGGLNRFEDTSYKKALLGIPMDESWEKTYIKSLFGVIKAVIRNPAYIKPAFLPAIFKAYLFGDPYALGSRFLERKITLSDMFYYIKWDEDEVLSRIRNELDWEKPDYLESTWRFDCQVVLMKDLIYLKSFGISEKDDLYSKMVREGLISRSAALERLDRENVIHHEKTKKLAAAAGVEYDYLLEVLEKNSNLNESHKQKSK